MSTIQFKLNDVPNGGMTSFEHGDQRILVVRDDDTLRAFDGKCPHAGADLGTGLRCDNRIVCPWHHATFDAQTGKLLEPIGTQDLKQYPIRQDGDDHVIKLDDAATESLSSDNDGNGHLVNDIGSNKEVLIVGSGAVGFLSASWLRKQGFSGRIVMLTEDNYPPYNRPLLSKNYFAKDMDDDSLMLGGHDWAKESDIELQLSSTVDDIDPDACRVTLKDGNTRTGDYLIIATGASPVRPDLPGSTLKQVYDLRTLDDAKAIKAAVADKRVVIIGSSFIGLEAAASVTQGGNALSVTVVGREATLLDSVLSSEVGSAIQNLHEEHGVVFKLDSSVEHLNGDEAVSSVQLASGEKIDADVVIFGTGVMPNLEAVQTAQKDTKAGVQVSATLGLSKASYAGGDVAQANTIFGHKRIEHWRVAMQHGMIIADNILKQEGLDVDIRPFDERVPFFWTQQYGKSLRYIGHASTPDYAILRGQPNELNFIEFYFDSDADGAKVVAASGLGRDQAIIAIGELIRLDNAPTRLQIKDGLDVVEHLKACHQA